MWFAFPGQQYSLENVWICLLLFMGNSFMNKALYDAGFAGRLKVKVEVVPTIKGHRSELQSVSETALNVRVVLALGVRMYFRTNKMGTLSDKAAKGANDHLC